MCSRGAAAVTFSAPSPPTTSLILTYGPYDPNSQQIVDERGGQITATDSSGVVATAVVSLVPLIMEPY